MPSAAPSAAKVFVLWGDMRPRRARRCALSLVTHWRTFAKAPWPQIRPQGMLELALVVHRCEEAELEQGW